jgi:hypothetical protein
LSALSSRTASSTINLSMVTLFLEPFGRPFGLPLMPFTNLPVLLSRTRLVSWDVVSEFSVEFFDVCSEVEVIFEEIL